MGINDHLLSGFVDEGSSSTMISKSLAEKLGLTIEYGKFGGFKNADGSVTMFVGRINNANVQLHNELLVVLRHIMVTDTASVN